MTSFDDKSQQRISKTVKTVEKRFINKQPHLKTWQVQNTTAGKFLAIPDNQIPAMNIPTLGTRMFYNFAKKLRIQLADDEDNEENFDRLIEEDGVAKVYLCNPFSNLLHVNAKQVIPIAETDMDSIFVSGKLYVPANIQCNPHYFNTLNVKSYF